jgi:hypothetical protein
MGREERGGEGRRRMDECSEGQKVRFEQLRGMVVGRKRCSESDWILVGFCFGGVDWASFKPPCNGSLNASGKGRGGAGATAGANDRRGLNSREQGKAGPGRARREHDESTRTRDWIDTVELTQRVRLDKRVWIEGPRR